ncbi:MAG: type II secretion system F family protein [Bdellovibrionales bacterium]|nr:type II secretion system F family protein [Bdellovibrionales bacterium]
MAEFVYIAADRSGKKIEGKMEAASEGELRMTLRGQGLRPLKISRPNLSQQDLGMAIKEALGIKGSVPIDRLMNFIRQLQVMINSGVPLVQAIDLFYEQEADPTLRGILAASAQKIKQGSFLWESFAAYPHIFEKVFVALIRAGESSGTLDVMLKRVGKYMENAYRLKKLIKKSMTYPITVLVIATGVVALMLIIVIPKFEEMITSAGGTLPLPTQIVINMSHWLIRNFFIIVVGGAAAAFIARTYLKSREGQIVFQKTMLKLPISGDLIVKSGVARFSRTMSTLLASGVPMVDSLEICRSASSHIAFEDAIGEMKKEVELGASFATAMVRQKVFPKMATQMAAVGENTGNMDKMLEKVADFYEEEVENAIEGMMKMIEPLMLVFLGGVVGGLMISMYLPIFQMAGNTGG